MSGSADQRAYVVFVTYERMDTKPRLVDIQIPPETSSSIDW